jgi:hypothetical protein
MAVVPLAVHAEVVATLHEKAPLGQDRARLALLPALAQRHGLPLETVAALAAAWLTQQVERREKQVSRSDRQRSAALADPLVRLTCPRLTCPRLTCPRLTCPRLACPRLACPRLTCPRLTLGCREDTPMQRQQIEPPSTATVSTARPRTASWLWRGALAVSPTMFAVKRCSPCWRWRPRRHAMPSSLSRTP